MSPIENNFENSKAITLNTFPTPPKAPRAPIPPIDATNFTATWQCSANANAATNKIPIEDNYFFCA